VCRSLCALIAPIAYAITVSVPEKSQPESITVAPNGDLILGSAASAKIYRAKKGSDKVEVFVDASADGAVSFLGVLAESSIDQKTGTNINPHLRWRASDSSDGRQLGGRR
jgi:hypothetical protein